MAEDQANSKDSAKEQILEAIQNLKNKGAEINPYTVANESKLPRSTIYRNAELMELISREKAEPAEKLAAKQAGFPDRVAELEAQVEELGQTIWNLEKQNEDLQKDFSDAWTMGFAAGMEEANKRHAKGITPGSSPTVTEGSAWPSVERNASSDGDGGASATSEGSAIVTPAPEPQADFSGMPDEKDVPPHTAPVISPVSMPVAATTTAPAAEVAVPPASFKRGIDQAESGTFNAAAAPVKSQVLSSMIDFSTAAEGAASDMPSAHSESKSPVKKVDGSAGGDKKVIFADPPSDEFAYFGDEVVLSDEYLYSPELLKEAEAMLFGGGNEVKAPVEKPASPHSSPLVTPESRRAGEAAASSDEITSSNYTLDFSQSSNYASGNGGVGVGVESGLNIAAVASAQVIEGPRPTPAADIFAAQHAYDPTSGIYNVARSGPYVASEFNPLIELSWKDIEDVYNFRASTLKDYARNVPSAPNKLGSVVAEEEHNGTNGGDKKAGEFAEDNSLLGADILAMLPSDDELSRLQQLETAVYMSEEVTDIMPEGGFGLTGNQDPDATGDRMQAMVGYKADAHPNRLNPVSETSNSREAAAPSGKAPIDSDGIVDLDAIDIFDNLDEWIDIDKLERGEDPFGKPGESAGSAAAAAAQGVRQDELSELIKRRIEQASEVQAEPPGPRGLGLGKPATHAGPQPAAAEPAAAADAGQPRAKNKFIGGKASADGTTAPPPSNAPFVKALPPDIRKACLILGVRQEDMTLASVVESWKRQIIEVHPDRGGDPETAVILNTAKDTLVKWIEAQAPKLGNKFKAKEQPHKDDKK